MPETAIPLFIVDAFAERAFAGNPAAICALPRWPEDRLLLAVAAELNLSETAFLVGGGGAYEIRWFTPTREVDLIGHATLAAAHAVFGELEPGTRLVRFRSGAETIAVERQGDQLAMDFPALPTAPFADLDTLAAALRARPSAARAGKHYMAIFEDAASVRALEPDMAALQALKLPALMATAPGDEPGIDFVSRFFAPANGVPEDPVSGVAHLAMVPYWSERLGKPRLVGRQLSRRGGVVVGIDRGARVTLLGRTVLVARGTIQPAGAMLP
jgi:PhzF family phenazine biosynthesis protein